MHRHYADFICATFALTLDLDIASIEPRQKLLQSAALLLFKLHRRIKHFLNGNQRLTAQARSEFSPTSDWSGQDLLEKMIDGGEVRRR